MGLTKLLVETKLCGLLLVGLTKLLVLFILDLGKSKRNVEIGLFNFLRLVSKIFFLSDNIILLSCADCCVK